MTDVIEKLDSIHNELWKQTMERLEEKQVVPNGAFLVNAFSYDGEYVTTAAQVHVDASDLVNIGSDIAVEGILQLIAKHENYDGDDETLKELTPIDIGEAGIEKAVDIIRSKVRTAITARLKGDTVSTRKRVYVDGEGNMMDPDTMNVVEETADPKHTKLDSEPIQ